MERELCSGVGGYRLLGVLQLFHRTVMEGPVQVSCSGPCPKTPGAGGAAVIYGSLQQGTDLSPCIVVRKSIPSKLLRGKEPDGMASSKPSYSRVWGFLRPVSAPRDLEVREHLEDAPGVQPRCAALMSR